MATSMIDLNSASVGTLTQLPGIAKNMAYRIVDYRDKHGPFSSWEELERIKEFPTERLEEIKLRAVLGPTGDRRAVTRDTEGMQARYRAGRQIGLRAPRF